MVIGSYLYENGKATGASYKNVPCCYTSVSIWEITEDILFQQHGAPPHCDAILCQYLDQKLSSHWMCREGLTFCPPGSSG